jgi:hypothetical protein
MSLGHNLAISIVDDVVLFCGGTARPGPRVHCMTLDIAHDVQSGRMRCHRRPMISRPVPVEFTGGKARAFSNADKRLYQVPCSFPTALITARP